MNRHEAIIKGGGEYNIKLDNISKVSIEGITLRDSECGIFIGSSKDCKIEDNQITSSDKGICVGNCSRTLIGYNNIDGLSTTGIGIRLDDSSCVYIYHNDIETKNYHIYLKKSYKSIIYNKLDDCKIHENGKDYTHVNKSCYYFNDDGTWDALEEHMRINSNIWVCCG